MTTLYLIRHAEAEGNLFKRVHGQFDSPVTRRGREQIACLERRFASIPIDAVYSSDLRRTCQTAEAVCGPKGLPLHREPGLREVNLGVFEDITFGDLARMPKAELAGFYSGELDWKAEGGETLRQVRDRVCQTLRRIIAENPGRIVAVFSHGTAIRLALTHLMELDHYLPEGLNTAVARIEADEVGIRVCFYNDTTHFTGELKANSIRPNQGADAPERSPAARLLWFRPWAREGEQDYYLSCRQEGWMSSHGTMEGYDGAAFLDAAVAHSARCPEAVLVVMADETPVGMLELDVVKGAEEGIGAICFYYLSKEARCHGLGVQLLGQAVSVYTKLGRTRLRLRCAPENTSARRFYERNGFQKIGMAEDSAVPLYVMERMI